MAQTWWNLFLAFFRSSMLSYGGGPASIPLMRQEVVDIFKWLSNEQFADALAMANTLPGPIAPKMGAYVGYSVAGIAGGIIGVCATVVPTAVIIVAIAGLLLRHKDSPYVRGMLSVAKPIVVVLLAQTIIEMSTRNTFPSYRAFIVAGLTFAAVILLKIHPGIVMASGLAIGFFFFR